MKNLTESLEKYLLAIYNILKTKSDIKVKDVASYLNIGGAATSDAIKTLAERGFLNYVPYGTISLTESGLDVIQLKLYRHNVLSEFFNKVLEIDKEISDKNAKIVEYSMTEEVLEKFVHFLDFMGQCSCHEPKWLKSCKYNLSEGKVSKKCENCISGVKSGCKSCCGGCDS